MVSELSSKEMKDKETEKLPTRKDELHLKRDMDWPIVWDNLLILEVRYLDLDINLNLVFKVNMNTHSLKILSKSLLVGRLDSNHLIHSFKKNKNN